MTIADWVATVASFFTVTGMVGGVIIAVAKAHMDKVVRNLVKDYLSELKPNHGSSLRDDINRIKEDITDLKVDLASLEGKFDQHIEENS